MFPLYHNRICFDFQRIRSIFYVKNITKNENLYALLFFIKMESRAEPAVNVEIISCHLKLVLDLQTRKNKMLYLSATLM